MKSRSLLFAATSAASIGILVGCQDQPTAEERLASYSKLWEKQDYDKMYADYVSQTTQKEYGESQFIERTKKLNDTLEIKNISITPGKAPDTDDEKKQLLPVTVKFDTVAGPVSFKKEVPLVYETNKDTDNWYVDWDPSFLFEDFEQADQIKLNTLTAKRGDLIDRNEKPLATTGQGFEVGVTAGQLDDTTKKKVASLLDRSMNSIDDALSASWVKDGQFVPLKTFDPSDEATVKRLTALKGVSVKETEVRTYPYGEATSHLIGYVGSATAEDVEQSNNKIQAGEQVGKRGLEQVFDDELRGQSGTSIEIVKSDQDEPVTVAETKVKDGKDITLTIDGALQQSTYETMNGEPGVATALDPRTGETRTLVNSARGNLDFDNGGTKYSGCDCNRDGDSWEPPTRVKGDIARMIFYMAVRYEGGGEIDLETSENVNNGSNPLHGKLSTLKAWNKLDPVDAFEKKRNDIIFEKWQKNRNPFIDHPEYATAIWGN